MAAPVKDREALQRLNFLFQVGFGGNLGNFGEILGNFGDFGGSRGICAPKLPKTPPKKPQILLPDPQECPKNSPNSP
uniref:Uncharacterized protein n=1 Tax=Serinus canaria TaxID=9135 RepID=A0A8C9MFM5_SERCA